VEAVPVIASEHDTRTRAAFAEAQRNPAFTLEGARKAFGVAPKRSRIVPWTLAIAFLLMAGFAHWQNGVIREQSKILGQYESGAESIVRSYESANIRAQMALAAYDRCRGLMGVSAP
jgi:hypothetical protein